MAISKGMNLRKVQNFPKVEHKKNPALKFIRRDFLFNCYEPIRLLAIGRFACVLLPTAGQ